MIGPMALRANCSAPERARVQGGHRHTSGDLKTCRQYVIVNVNTSSLSSGISLRSHSVPLAAMYSVHILVWLIDIY